MKVDWKKFCYLFVLCNLLLLCSGCSASWVGAINALWPAISTAISAVFAFLSSVKTVPASAQAALQKVQADIQASLQNATSLLATLATNTTATVIQQFQTVLQFIVTNLQAILSGISVTDPDTVSTATKLVNLAIAAIEAILVIIPLAVSKLTAHASPEDMEAADRTAASHLKNTHKVLQHTYREVVTTTTGTIAVNEALATLPQSLP